MDRSYSNNGDWIPVGKKSRSIVHGNANLSPQDFHTLFVDNLPLDVAVDEIRSLFNKFGVVRDVFIPLKRSKVSGNKFGFVRYDCHVAADVAILKANGTWLKDRKLFVKFASFGKKDVNDDRRLKKARNHGLEMGDGLSSGIPDRFQSYQNKVDFVKTVGKGVQFMRKNIGVGSYAEALTGHKEERKLATKSIQCHSIGSGWLFRSAIAKIRKLLSANDLVSVFKRENVHDVQIKAIGGRFVVVTFANEGTRDKILKERWVKNWFDEFQPWNGEQAKEERFVWISCFGMPLSVWSSQTFRDIGSIWGDFIEVDENTLNGGSYEKGRILIATDQSQKIEGNIELVEDGTRYMVRIEEEDSFRKVESSNFMAVNNSLSIHEDQLSQVPNEAQSLVKDLEEDPIDSSSKFTQGLESFVEDSLGLQSLFHEIQVDKPKEKSSSHVKLVDAISDDSSSIDKSVSGGFDYGDWDLVSDEPLIKYVECVRRKKTLKSKKDHRRKTLWSKNPLKTAMIARSGSRGSIRNISRLRSKKGSFDGSLDGPTHSSQEEVSSDICKRNLNLIKDARDNMKMTVRLGVKYHGRESYNIKKLIELMGVVISEQEIKAELIALDNLEGDASISVEF